MSVLENVADSLAMKTLDAIEAAGGEDDSIVTKISDAIGNTSPTLQEAFLTQVRIRRAERRALAVLKQAKSG